MKKISIILLALLVVSLIAACNSPVPPAGAGGENSTPIADRGEESVEIGTEISEEPEDNGIETSGIPEDEENADSSRDEVSFEVSGDYVPDTEVSSEESAPYDPDTEVSTEPEPEPEPEPDDKVKVKIPTPVVPVVNTPVWDGSVADGFASGTGTESDPFIIETAPQLAYFAKTVDEGNDYVGQFVKLANNIKLNEGNLNVKELDGTGLNKWNAIGENKSSFMGTFDGNNHVVSGLYEQGLFHIIKGTVKNVGVINSHLVGFGAIAGSASGFTAELSEDIYVSNCFAVDSVVHGEGGLFNTVNIFIVKDCYNGATVYSSGDWNGGITCQVFGGKLINCYNAGTVDGRSEYGWDLISGGIAGNLLKGEIIGCYNIGDIITDTNMGGGLCGVRYDNTVLEDCGYLEGSAPFAYEHIGATGEKIISNDEIIIFTESQIEK